MATVNITLSNYQKRDGTFALELKIRQGNRTIPRSTGISIPAKDWDAARQLVKRSNPLFSEFNDALRAKVHPALQKSSARFLIYICR